MENVSQVTNIKLSKKKSDKEKKTDKHEELSSSYKSPFVNVFNDTFVHSDVFGDLISIFTDIEKNPRVVMTFRNHRDIYINFTNDILLKMYKKKITERTEKKTERSDKEKKTEISDKVILTDDNDIINKMLTKVVENVKNKYKIYIKSKDELFNLHSKKTKHGGDRLESPKKKVKKETSSSKNSSDVDNEIDSIINNISDEGDSIN